jgi:glycosyltransferase involved in cell wall biosynthesis
MKILHILDSLNRGGAEVLALDVCKNASKNGLDLTFVATGEGILFDDFQNSGVNFHYFKRRFPIDLNVVRNLRKLIKSEQIQLIHAHQAVEGMHAYFASLGTKTKIILSHHGFISDRKNLFSLKFLLKKVSANIVVSQALLNWYESETKLKFPNNTIVIHNGVDQKRLKWNGENLKTELGLSLETKLFGMVGNFYLAPRKDQLTVCQALKIVFAKEETLHFVFVGGFTKDAEAKFLECRQFCENNNLLDRIHFLGVRTDIPKILNSLDCFVLSSFHEGLPISVLEAMLCNLPCVLSDILPNLEVSNNGKFAKIFETQNANNLAEVILNLLKHRGLRDTSTIKFAENNYSIEAHISKLKSIYGNYIK